MGKGGLERVDMMLSVILEWMDRAVSNKNMGKFLEACLVEGVGKDISLSV